MTINMKEALMKAGKIPTVVCPYCRKNAKLVNGTAIYPHRPDLAQLNFWHCKPCDAYVGCHKPTAYNKFDATLPLGRLADSQLRKAKSAAHKSFDPIWKEGRKTRAEAYAWLANQLCIDPSDCHIGMFDVDMCNRVQSACISYWTAS